MTSWFLQKSLPPAGKAEGIRPPARNHQERSPENTYYRGGDLSCSQKLIPSTDERQGTFFKKVCSASVLTKVCTTGTRNTWQRTL